MFFVVADFFLCLYICFYFSDISDLGIWSETRHLIDPGLSAYVPQLFDLVLSSTLLVRPIITLTVGVVGTAGRSRRRECLYYQPNLYTSLYTCWSWRRLPNRRILVILPLILHFLVFVGVTRWQVWSHRRSTPRSLRLQKEQREDYPGRFNRSGHWC